MSEDVIRRRYAAGLVTMRDFYLPLAKRAQIYDNQKGRLEMIASKELNASLVIHDEAKWSLIQEAEL